MGLTRPGVTVAAIGADTSPWAVVQLSVRVPDGTLSPTQRALLGPLARALAQGRSAAQPAGLDLTGFGATAKASADADTLSISLGAPAERLEDLLKAMDARLRVRKSLLPAQGTVAPLLSADPALDGPTLALAAPGHPDALPVDGGSTADPRALRELADLVLTASGVRFVLVGPGNPAELLLAAQKVLTTPLPPGDLPAALPHVFGDGTRLAEVPDASTRHSTSEVSLFCAGADPWGPDAARAAVLATLLGGSTAWSDDVVAIVVQLPSARASDAVGNEGKLLQTLARLADTPPPDDVVRGARDQARAARLSQWTDPDRLASSVARARDPAALLAALESMKTVGPAELQQLARRCASGPRVVRRRLGAAR